MKRGEIIGIVSVGFMKREVREVISNRLLKIILISLFVLFLGSVGGVPISSKHSKGYSWLGTA
jgi:CitB family two-component system sensor histidine kinase CitS